MRRKRSSIAEAVSPCRIIDAPRPYRSAADEHGLYAIPLPRSHFTIAVIPRPRLTRRAVLGFRCLSRFLPPLFRPRHMPVCFP